MEQYGNMLFRESEHGKAWFIKVTTNICHDMGRYQLRHPTCSLEDVIEYQGSEEQKIF